MLLRPTALPFPRLFARPSSILLPHLRTPLVRSRSLQGACLGASLASIYAFSPFTTSRPPLLCDAPPSAASTSGSASRTVPGASARPQDQAFLTPSNVRKLTLGSITGFITGLAIGLFSKPLAILVGMALLGSSAVESQTGMRIVPYDRVIRWVRERVAQAGGSRMEVEDLLFKVPFAVTALLAGFGEF